MQIKNEDVRTLWSAILELQELELPITLSFKLARNRSILEPIARQIQIQIEQACKRYSDDYDVEKQEYKFNTQDSKDTISNILEELSNISNNLELIPISINEFNDINIKPDILYRLNKILSAE